ncbi:MAG: TetR family transcriptional regulator C-terminal domain-containing protein [Rubellimicrobium sp.]|nr:TetR family transcriptional regulator C-terminal domain-containing protein [Rubellimicrobium sp.]
MSQAKRQPRYRRFTGDARRAMLIEAGMACLARGGIRDFTVDSISAEAGVSRSLIAHHFGSKDGLLAAVYAEMYSSLLSRLGPDEEATIDLAGMIDILAREHLIEDANLNAWLALWGEVQTNPALLAEHRRHYLTYRARVANVIRREAAARGRAVDADRLAVMVIALIDGLWLERGIDPSMLGGAEGREACYQLLEAFVGPLPRASTPVRPYPQKA